MINDSLNTKRVRQDQMNSDNTISVTEEERSSIPHVIRTIIFVFIMQIIVMIWYYGVVSLLLNGPGFFGEFGSDHQIVNWWTFNLSGWILHGSTLFVVRIGTLIILFVFDIV